MLIKRRQSSSESENNVTPEAVFRNRRQLLKSMGFMGAGALLSTSTATQALGLFGNDDDKFKQRELSFSESRYRTSEKLTPEAKVTSYNNFYEFGTGKDDPIENAQSFVVDPWYVSVDGLVEKPLTLSYDDLFSRFAIEERIYRLRCVEAWSMVIPWVGFSLATLIQAAQPLSGARYVRFETLHDPEQMPGQRSRFVGGGIDYPYVEGLRIDEATHPLAFMAVGVYGKTLPPQNGAPIRLVVPWKYGFKSIKSVVKISLVSEPPVNTWQQLIPSEYGFYANVNPSVDHPRWSQARERRITSGGLFSQNRIATKMFNGYDEVASLYSDMDLRKYY
ncbi:MAG: protein-methionine-sulfoxide reductase catalytic subunit MsrP [Aestuariibacter sp.]